MDGVAGARVAMLSPPSGPHGTTPASRRTDSAQRCDEHTVVAAVRLQGSLMKLSTPAAPKGRRLLRSCDVSGGTGDRGGPAPTSDAAVGRFRVEEPGPRGPGRSGRKRHRHGGQRRDAQLRG